MYHKVILLGRLGADPVMRYTAGGQPVTTLRVATNEVWTDKEGERRERTIWWTVSVWGKQAELVNEYLSKGRQVLVEGRVVVDENTGGPRTWIGQDGQPRASLEVRANMVRFVGGRGEAAPPAEDFGTMDENDIPF